MYRAYVGEIDRPLQGRIKDHQNMVQVESNDPYQGKPAETLDH